MNFHIEFDFFRKYPLFKSWDGKLRTDISLKAEFKIRVNVNQESQIILSIAGIEIHHELKNISVEGGAFLSLLIKSSNVFKGLIDKLVSKALKDSGNSLIGDLNNKIDSKISIPVIGSDLSIKLNENLTYKEEYLQVGLDLDLEIQENKNKKSLSGLLQEILERLSSQDTPKNKNSRKTNSESYNQIDLKINEELINSILEPIYKKQILKISITSDLIPAELPFKLNTYYFSKVLPEMYEKYPDEELIVSIELDRQPIVNLNESEEVFDLTTRLLLSFKLVKDPSLIIFSFDANIEGKLVLQPNMDENKLHFLIKSAEFSDLAIMVPCGELDTEELANIFNILLNTGIYIVNGKFLENGITLPSAYGVSIEKINLKITGDYVEIGLVPKFQ